MTALLRTLVITIVLCGFAWLGYRQWMSDEQARVIADLTAMNARYEQQLAERQAMLDRLSRSKRIAHVQVVDQSNRPSGEVDQTKLLFIELSENGAEIGRQEFTLPGDVVYIDGWTVKFEHDDVAQGDPLRGRTLVLLRKVFSDRMPPRDGLVIDTPGAIPPGYAASEIGAFEKRIWDQFWDIATNPELSQRMGVRVAQGEAVYKPMRKGQMFELTLDAAGGMNLVPLATTDSALTKASNHR